MFLDRYEYRLILLVVFFIFMAFIDYYRKGKASQKWKHYLVVLSCALIFAILGAIHDQITLTLSKEYYTVGKGVPTQNLRRNVLLLGLKTGSYAGIVFSMILLYFGLVKNMASIVRYMIPVGLTAIFGLILGAAAGYMFYLGGFKIINSGNNVAFLTIWGWHIGLYLGAILGLLYVVIKNTSPRPKLRY